MADIDAAFEQQIFDLAERQWISDIHHHREADHFRRTVEAAERISHPSTLSGSVSRLNPDCSDNALADAPGQLFAELIPYFLLRIDHASYARFGDRPFGKWDVWMNVINVEADHGSTEAALFETFYSERQDWDTTRWREMAAFSSCVLRPLEWVGFLIENREEDAGKHVCHVFKTPLWRSALNLETDDMLRPMTVQ